MKNFRQPPRTCVSAGFSLIELMVSMAIGLLMVGAALTAYVSSSGASKMAEAQSRMNEDAQAALSILSQQIRMAGNNPYQSNRTDESHRNPVYGSTPTFTIAASTVIFAVIPPSTFALSHFEIQGCNSKFTNISNISNPDELTCNFNAASASPNSIAISYEADTYNTIPTTKTILNPRGLPTDCLGNALEAVTAEVPMLTVPAPAAAPPTLSASDVKLALVTYYVADNRFYIDTSANTLAPSLYCKGNSGTPQPLVENIENLQFLYGVIPSSTEITPPFGYLTASAVTDSSTAIPDRAVKWKNIKTVRICVVVRSETAFLVSDNASANYIQCDGTLNTTNTDRRLRRAYSTTVALRNRLL